VGGQHDAGRDAGHRGHPERGHHDAGGGAAPLGRDHSAITAITIEPMMPPPQAGEGRATAPAPRRSAPAAGQVGQREQAEHHQQQALAVEGSI